MKNTHSQEILEVIIRDDGLNIISKISETTELSKFQSLWESKYKVVAGVQPTWNHKIDINPGNRWLYSEAGYAQMLSKKVSKIYLIDNVAQFNELIKI